MATVAWAGEITRDWHDVPAGTRVRVIRSRMTGGYRGIPNGVALEIEREDGADLPLCNGRGRGQRTEIATDFVRRL